MREWITLLRFFRDNVALIVFCMAAGVFLAGWVILAAIRGRQNRDEIFRLRRKLGSLERERMTGFQDGAGSVVLSSRWIRAGAAAATTDGGCLVLLERVLQPQNRAVLTLRVDGYAAVQSRSLSAGERLDAAGKSGTYSLRLYGVEGVAARLSVALRSRHLDHAADAVD